MIARAVSFLIRMRLRSVNADLSRNSSSRDEPLPPTQLDRLAMAAMCRREQFWAETVRELSHRISALESEIAVRRVLDRREDIVPAKPSLH